MRMDENHTEQDKGRERVCVRLVSVCVCRCKFVGTDAGCQGETMASRTGKSKPRQGPSVLDGLGWRTDAAREAKERE